MPIYTLQFNLRTQRAQAYDKLGLLFSHAESLGLTINSFSLTTSGGNNGRISIDVVQSLSADLREHFGLA